MKQGNRLISAVLAVIMAVSVLLPFNAMPSFADEGTVVVLSQSALSNASDYNLDVLETQYGNMIDDIVEGLNNHQERINIYSYRLLPDMLTSVVDYLKYYRLCFFLDPQAINYSCDGTYVYEFIPTYVYTADEIEQYRTELVNTANSVISAASQLGTDVEKLLYIHNYLVDTVIYDSVGNLNQNNAYGAMILHSSMCEGYAGSFAYMANQLGIKTYVITSVGIGHAWNLVLLDGYYYHIDCTWDDPTVTNMNLISNPLSGYAQNRNFLCSDAEITATGHNTTDWQVNGVSVYGIAANSTMYSSFELKDENTLSRYSDGSWYFAYNGRQASSRDTVNFKIIRIAFASNDVYVRYVDRQIYTYYLISNTGAYYSLFYSTLQELDGGIYYSTSSGIYKLVPGGAANGSDDILIFSNNVDNNIYDFDIDAQAGTFSVAFGKTIAMDNATTCTYSIADYFCATEGHRYHTEIVSDLTDITDGIWVYRCGMCGDNYTEQIYCKQTMLNFFYAALNSRITDSNYNAIADVNHDGFVNVRDYALIVDYSYLNDTSSSVHEHTPVTDEAVAPTCTSTGLTEGSHCATCGEVLVAQTEIPMVEHTWGDATLTPASSGTPGVIARICTVCGEAKTEIATGWQIYGGNTYYYNDNGYPLTGFNQIGSTTYYFNAAGVMQTGWQQIGSNLYYFDEQGAMTVGWKSINGVWYYFDSSGVMQTGMQTINGNTYYFDSTGAMQTGWQTISGSKYYFSSSGAMVTGWQTIDGAKYYFNTDGKMVTGWKKIGSYWYYFNSDGTMKTGWLKDGSYWYYLDSDGKMLANTSRTINGKTYNFNSSGVCTNP